MSLLLPLLALVCAVATGCMHAQEDPFTAGAEMERTLLERHEEPSMQGIRLLPVPDTDGDGIEDLAVGLPFADCTAGKRAGRVVLVGTRNGDVLAEWSGRSAGENLGHALEEGPAVDPAEGRVLWAGAPCMGIDDVRAGSIYEISLQERALLRVLAGPEDLQLVGFALARIPDVTGDAVEDLLVCAPRWARSRAAHERHGDACVLDVVHATFQMPITLPVAANVPDVLLTGAVRTDAPVQDTFGCASLTSCYGDRVAFLRAAPLDVLCDEEGPDFSGFGWSLAAVVGPKGASPRMAVARCFDGAVSILERRGDRIEDRGDRLPSDPESHLVALAALPDLDGDGWTDLALGAPGPGSRSAFFGIEMARKEPRESGRVLIISSERGTVLREIQHGPRQPWFGKQVVVLRSESPGSGWIAIGWGALGRQGVELVSLADGSRRGTFAE